MRAFSIPGVSAFFLFGMGLMLFVAGCSLTPTGLPKPVADHAQRMHHGYIYYLDGAGGGTAQKNWAEGVKDGVIASGYPGAGEMFSWETGDGLFVDQVASVDYKRAKAREAAAKISQHAKEFPGVPLNLLGFSAGTAVVVWILEDLPKSVKVDNVVLLGTSLSESYDLTEALKHVRGHLYLYTSTRDRMLGFLMPLSGTADRKFDDPGAGINGFVLPACNTPETRGLYLKKVVMIPWTEKLEKDGNYGGHFDNVKMEFIRDDVAPLFMGRRVPGLSGARPPKEPCKISPPPA